MKWSLIVITVVSVMFQFNFALALGQFENLIPENMALKAALSKGAEASASIAKVQAQMKTLRQQAPSLNFDNCQHLLDSANEVFSDWMPSPTEQNRLRAHGYNLLSDLFKTRLALHDQMANLSPRCISSLRDLFRNMRASEDIIGVMYYNEPQVAAEAVQFEAQPIPLMEADKYRPYFLNPKLTQFQFQKGDLMITKGISIISGTISSMPVQPSLFSHIAYVYQDPMTKEMGTIESYIGKGVDFYTMKEALVNENARIVVVRAKDQLLAVKGHDYIVQRVKKSFFDNNKISYDYEMDFKNNSTLSCEEIAYDAFNVASHGQFIIPTAPSEILVKNKKFISGTGLKNGPTMMPADMELDPRFEIVLEWTDYRLMRDNWRKDAIMSEVLRWINEEHYVLSNNFTATVGQMLWATRQIPFLWPIAARITGIPADYEVGVPKAGIALMANLRVIGPAIMAHLVKADEAFFKLSGRWMSRAELRQYVNYVRLQDLDNYNENRGSEFHYFFRAPTLSPLP